MTRWATLRIGTRDVIVLPRRAVLPADPTSVAALIDDALGHPEGREALARWLDVDDADLEDPEVRDRAITALTSGHWRAIELEQADPIVSEDPITPTDPRKPDDPRPTRPTWIAINVTDEDGRAYASTSWTLTTADGDDRAIRLDEGSSWRADDLKDSGTCFLRVGQSVPEPTPGGRFSADADAAWIEAEASASVPLRTGVAHTVVIVRGRTEIVVLDEAGRPEADEWCEVTIEGRVQKRRTNEQGVLALAHPRRVEVIDVRFVLLSDGAVALDRSVPLATEADG